MKKMIAAGILILIVYGIASSDTGSGDPDTYWEAEPSTETYTQPADYTDTGYGDLSYEAPYGNQAVYDLQTDCRACGGSGYSDRPCTWCNGSGENSAYELTEGSVMHTFAEKDCPKCGGTKLERCRSCSGTGKE